jgi:signal transduction histidine kinase
MLGRRDDSEPAPLVDVGDTERIPSYIVVSGIVLGAGMIGQGVVLGSLESPLRRQPAYLLGVLGSLTATTVIIAVGYWLDRNGVDSDRYRRILAWYLGGLTVAALAVLLVVRTASTAEGAVLYWLHVGTSGGGAVGLLVGNSEARTVERELATQRADLESTYRQRQRSFLKHLHALVRHEVLNTTQVISGYATNRMHDLDEDDREYEYYETISDQSRSLAAIVEDIEILLRASDSASLVEETTDLGRLLGRELEQVREKYPETELALSGEEPAFVRTEGSISTVLGYLIGHRIEAANGAIDRVTVTLDATGDTVTVTITDDGPPLASDEIHSPFEQPPEMDRSHGWALYLTDAVVELYDGTVDLGPSGSSETTITVELPQAEPSRHDADSTTSPDVADPKELF